MNINMNKIKLLMISFIFSVVIFPNNAFSVDYYVSPDGSDATGDGSSGNPWKTPKYGCATMLGGDTLILKNGTYVDVTPSQLTCDNQIRPPSGSPGNYTIIKAENDWQAIIDWSGCGSGADGDVPVRIYGGGTKEYIQIEGLKFINTDCAVYTRSCSHIKLKRLAVISSPASGNDDDGYSEPFAIVRDSHYVLLEDSWVSGCIRYGVIVIGDNGNPTGIDTDHVIIRRVVVRTDYKYLNQPKACFAAYGGNSPAAGSVDNIIFQNCIAMDWNPGDGMDAIYGGFYNPKITGKITYRGCIALNLKPGDSNCNGFYTLDNYNDNIGPALMTNCIAWDVKGMGNYWDKGGVLGVRSVTATADQCTFGDLGASTRYIYARDESTGGDIFSTLSNSIIDTNNSNSNDTHMDIEKYNSYNPSSLKPGGAVNSITTANGLLYLLRVEAGSSCKGAGEGGKDIGANILYKHGESGTLWGESGYDTLTNDSLWPWPNEEQIRNDFRTQNDPKGADTRPQTNDTTRGFCADGQTLTKYIWEYLGNEIDKDEIIDVLERDIKEGDIKVVGSEKGKGTINPDNGDKAKIYFKGKRVGTYTCRVFTLTGELVWEKTNQGTSEGMFEWAAKNVSSGTYIVDVKGPGFDKRKKIVIIK